MEPPAEVIPTGSFNHAYAPDMMIRPCASLSEAATEVMEPETDIKSLASKWFCQHARGKQQGHEPSP
jgi:hypothetical protein